MAKDRKSNTRRFVESGKGLIVRKANGDDMSDDALPDRSAKRGKHRGKRKENKRVPD